MKSNFLKLTLLLVFAVMLFAIPNDADAATYDIYTYTISGNEITITDCDTSASGAIVIPSEIEGKKVTSIGDSAFYKCTSLTSITIPESVTSIGWSAFSGCTSLKSVAIPDSVTSIGLFAFSDCINLEGVYITDVGAWCNIELGSYDANPLYYARNLYINETLVTSLEIPDTVTNIDGRFKYCRSLVSISIPDSVESIEKGAFRYCTSLEEITLPFVGANRDIAGTADSVFGYIFDYSTSSTSRTTQQYYSDSGSAYYYIPESLKSIAITGETKIPYGSFYNCISITSVTIGEKITGIEKNAFYNCSSLEKINYNAIKLSSSSSYNVFYKAGTSGSGIEVIFGDGVEEIPAGIFYETNSSYRPNIKSVTIGRNVKTIGSDAFYGCGNLNEVYMSDIGAWGNINFESAYSNPLYYAGSLYLNGNLVTELKIPDTVASIRDYAFYCCTSLESITIPESVTSIGRSAFYDCRSLTSITIPDTVTSIGWGAFSGCSNLKGVYISDLTAWCNVEFGDEYSNPLYYARILYLNGNLVTELEIPDTVASIGDYAFYCCTSLESITIPESVTSIGDSAFYNCRSLTSITIPESVTSIGDNAFCGCTSLTSITIPESVTSIGRYAFGECYSIETIKYNARKLDTKVASSTNIFCCAGIDGSGIEVVFGDSVEEVPAYLFYTYDMCHNVKSVSIGKNVTVIGEDAFYGCKYLTSVTIPDSVMTVGRSAFEYCTSLEEITLPFVGSKRGITGTVDSVFGYIFGYSTSSGSVTTRQYYSDSESAYYYIPSTLKKVTITDETVIPYGAFYNCANLTDVTIKGNPTAIMAAAFMGHENLWNVTIKSKNVRYANGQMFKTADMPTIYGYEGSTTETYAKNYDLWFVALSEEEEEGYALNADGTLVNGKIVLDITTNKPVTDQALHVALYNDASKLVDYIIVPLTKEYCSFNVVFRDEQNSSFAKVFLWDGLESMTPVTQAKSVTIKR